MDEVGTVAAAGARVEMYTHIYTHLSLALSLYIYVYMHVYMYSFYLAVYKVSSLAAAGARVGVPRD